MIRKGTESRKLNEIKRSQSWFRTRTLSVIVFAPVINQRSTLRSSHWMSERRACLRSHPVRNESAHHKVTLARTNVNGRYLRLRFVVLVSSLGLAHRDYGMPVGMRLNVLYM